MATQWQPTANWQTLKRRAAYLADIRLFFAERGIMEVATPILSSAAPTAPYLDSLTTHCAHSAQPQYLQTSPEFAMKRLLAAGSGAIYQLAPVFRNGELGKWHAPEFTMLEWYQPGLTLSALIEEVAQFLLAIFKIKECAFLSYRSAFIRYANIDITTCKDSELKNARKKRYPV